MELKLQRLYEECIEELKTIGINMKDTQNIGNIDITLSKRSTKRYGCCKQEQADKHYKVVQKRGYKKIVRYEKFKEHHIEISKWLMELDNEIIKNTIIHELIHCIPFCNNHGEYFKKYAKYINERLGYNIKRTGNIKDDYEKSNVEYQERMVSYKYKIKCKNCGQEILRQRFNVKKINQYRCGKCGGKLILLQEDVNNSNEK